MVQIDVHIYDALKLISKGLNLLICPEAPEALWQSLFSGLILTRRKITECRAVLNRRLRPIVRLGLPIEPGNRWDVIKDRCPVPPRNPYANRAPISVGVSAVESYTALELLNNQQFTRIQRYFVFKGPSQETLNAFANVERTIKNSKLEEAQKRKLLEWVKSQQKNWKVLVDLIAADKVGAERKTRDVRLFSNETISFAAGLYQTCEHGDLLKNLLPVGGLSCKDGEYWDNNGFPWDQKTMFDPSTIEGLSFEKAVYSFCSSVQKQAKDAADGLILKFDGTPCWKMGIMIDCTYVGERVYEACWGGLYVKFDRGSVPYFDGGQSLIREVVAQQGRRVITELCASQDKGLPGCLWQFHLTIAEGPLNLDRANKWLRRFVGSTLRDIVQQKLQGSWDCYRDYQEAIAPCGMLREIAFTHSDGKTAGRILVDRVAHRIFLCPLHYKRFVVQTGPIDATVRDHVYEVQLGNQAPSFWAGL
jgi:hypothetical protein